MHANFWPDPELIDLVITIHTDNTILYDRYAARGYNTRKVEENIDCEIMNVIGTENEEYFGPQEEEIEEEEPTATVVELISNDEKDMKRNVKAVIKWVEKWRVQRDKAGQDEKAMPRCVDWDAES